MSVHDIEDMPLYLVFWEDSRQPRGSWQHLHNVEVEEAVKVVSVGWLLETKSEGVVMLAPNVGDVSHAPQVSGVIEIPRLCITNMYPIEGAKED